jgi:hypothetical protein
MSPWSWNMVARAVAGAGERIRGAVISNIVFFLPVFFFFAFPFAAFRKFWAGHLMCKVSVHMITMDAR